jgi:peptidoglycan/xylan/chitin deacetylase (PgdA/CDA1 family)
MPRPAEHDGESMFSDCRPEPSVWTAISAKASRLLAGRLPTHSMRKVNPRPLVSFTFDDAPASSCREGAAILEGHGMR